MILWKKAEKKMQKFPFRIPRAENEIFFLMVLEFELRALHWLDRHSL
jgi:hypothetical protein